MCTCLLTQHHSLALIKAHQRHLKSNMGLLSTLAGYYRQIMDATKEFFIRILMGILIFLGYVLLSLFIYAVMRRVMVPQKLHSIPVHLQYE